MDCGLCQLHTIIHTYDETDPRWIIMDCMNCILPMAVWYEHTMEIPQKDWQEMEASLRKVADIKFGKNNYYIDTVQRQIPNHLHWHARPNLPRKS